MDILAHKVKWNIAEIRTRLRLSSRLNNKTQSQFSDLNSESKDSIRGHPWLCSWTSVDWPPVCLVPQLADLWTQKLHKTLQSQADNCKIFSFLTLPGNEIWFQERTEQQGRDRQDHCEDKFINSFQFPGTGRCPRKEPLNRGRRIRFENRSFPREQRLPFISAGGILAHTVP